MSKTDSGSARVVGNLKKLASSIYLVADEPVADDIAQMANDAISLIQMLESNRFDKSEVENVMRAYRDPKRAVITIDKSINPEGVYTFAIYGPDSGFEVRKVLDVSVRRIW